MKSQSPFSYTEQSLKMDPLALAHTNFAHLTV